MAADARVSWQSLSLDACLLGERKTFDPARCDNGVISSRLFGLLAARRERRVKKNAIAAWEAQRRDQQR
jgi:hypothetical protein